MQSKRGMLAAVSAVALAVAAVWFIGNRNATETAAPEPLAESRETAEVPKTSRDREPVRVSRSPQSHQAARTSAQDDTAAAEFRLRVVSETDDLPITAFETLFMERQPIEADLWEYLQFSPTAKWTAYSDSSGTASWPVGALAGSRAIGVRADNHAPVWKPLPPRADASEEMTVALAPGATVTGHVTDTLGQTLSGATVAIGLNEVQTGAAGQYSIGMLSPGSYTIGAVHPEYPRVDKTVHAAAGETATVDFVLTSGGGITGTVRSDEGPIGGLRVALSKYADMQSVEHMTTGNDGRYRFGGLAPGEWQVIASKTYGGGSSGDVHRVHQRAIVDANQETQVDFYFPETLSELWGLVRMGNAVPQRGRVKGHIISEYEETFFETGLDAEGAYLVECFPGTAELQVTAVTREGVEQTKTVRVDIPPRQSVQRDIDFAAPVALRGYVVSPRPGEAVNVYAVPAAAPLDLTQRNWGPHLTQAAVAQTVASTEGAFALDGLEPGAYTLVAVGFIVEPANGVDALDTVRIARDEVRIETSPPEPIELRF